MAEEDNKSVEQLTVEALKRKRRACRRVITRLQKKAAQLTAEPLGSLQCYAVELLKSQVKQALEKHDYIQQDIEQQLEEDQAALAAETDERFDRDEAHAGLLQEIHTLSKILQVWQDGQSLLRDTDSLKTLTDYSHPSFLKDFDKFKEEAKHFDRESATFRDHEEIASLQ